MYVLLILCVDFMVLAVVVSPSDLRSARCRTGTRRYTHTRVIDVCVLSFFGRREVDGVSGNTESDLGTKLL